MRPVMYCGMELQAESFEEVVLLRIRRGDV